MCIECSAEEQSADGLLLLLSGQLRGESVSQPDISQNNFREHAHIPTK